MPDDAVLGRKNTKRWPEKLTITRTSVEKIEGTDRYAFRIGFKVSADSPTVINRGRNTSGSFLYNPKADGNDAHPDSFMTKITVSRLVSLLTALGYVLSPGERPDFGMTFSDPEAPFLNMEVNAVMSDRPDRDDPNIRRQDIGSFTRVEG